MKFDNAINAFHYLLTQGEQSLERNLETIKQDNLEIFPQICKLVDTHINNAEHTEFNALVSEQAHNMLRNDRIFNLLGQQVGVYKLSKIIGQGGMGVVYLGERNDGKLKQNVAIKFILPAFTQIFGESYFLKEAQYLADLDHANITKILTVDITKDQLSYIVMEYIEGQPIDQYCTDHQLSVQERLDLFSKVCRAVQVAHQNMIIHADIKPSNILVDQHGEPKLMDFGIAQNIHKALNDNALKQAQSSYLLALSKDYASPEQIAAEPLTTGSDTFSLGKLLNVLIDNQTETLQTNELRHIVSLLCQPTLSDRICSISTLLSLLQRQRDGYPLPQFSTKAFYQFSKFIKRNMATVSAITASFLILVSSSALLYWQNNKLKEQTEIATKTQQYITDLFAYTDPDNHENLTLFELLNKGEKQLSSSTFANDNVLASIKMTMATAFSGLGKFSHAHTLLSEAKQVLANSNNDDLQFEINHRLALLHISLNQFEQALAILEENSKRADMPFEHQLMHWYGFADYYFAKGDFAKAIIFYQKSLSGHRSMANADQDIIAIILNNLSNAYKNIGELDKAIIHINESLHISKKLYGEIAHPRIATRLTNLGAIQSKLGHKEQAAASFEQALAIFRQIAPQGHKKEAAVINNIGALYSEAGNFKKALVYLNMSLNKVKETFGDIHVNTAILSNNIANAYRQVNQLDDAIIKHQEALQIFQHLKIGGVNLAVFKSNYARTLLKANQKESALKEINQAVTILTAVDKNHKGLTTLAQLKQQITQT